MDIILIAARSVTSAAEPMSITRLASNEQLRRARHEGRGRFLCIQRRTASEKQTTICKQPDQRIESGQC